MKFNIELSDEIYDLKLHHLKNKVSTGADFIEKLNYKCGLKMKISKLLISLALSFSLYNHSLSMEKENGILALTENPKDHLTQLPSELLYKIINFHLGFMQTGWNHRLIELSLTSRLFRDHIDQFKNTKAWKELIEATKYVKENPNSAARELIEDAKKNNIERVRFLLLGKAHLVDIDTEATALMFAAARNNKEIAEMLIDSNANIDAQNSMGSTALIVSVINNNQEILIKLLNAKANANIQGPYKRTALIWAILRGNKEIAQILLNYDADPTVKDDANKTALEYANIHGHIEIEAMLLAKVPSKTYSRCLLS